MPLKLMLSHGPHQLRNWHVEGFGNPDRVWKVWDDLMKLFTALFERREAHILATPHQQIEGIEHDC
jgi:hypothetical protein